MKKVLLASASKVFLKRNTNLLMRRGFRLFTAATGAEALKLHGEQRFDLILSDFKLGDMSGCTLCSLVGREMNFCHAPVILFCYDFPGSIERVEESGASAMLVKPIDPLKLLETVGSFIDLPLGRSKRVVLHVKVLSKKSEFQFYCYSHDISNTGILLETDFDLPLSSRIICEFTLPDAFRIVSEGEVIRCLTAQEGDNLYGIKFINLPFSLRRTIDSFVTVMANSGATT